MNLIKEIKDNLKLNENKFSYDFIEKIAKQSKVTHIKATNNVGIAQVLDKRNDVEEIGQKVAYENAVNEIWRVAGYIAKVIMDK